MICPSCGTWNRDDALFCKYCGFDLSKAPKPVTPAVAAPPPTGPPPGVPPAVPPPVGPPRVWWHGIGVFAILAAFLLFIDVATNARVTWSVVGILAAAFLTGGIMVLQFLASPDRRDRRPFLGGAVLLVAAVLLLPVTLAVLSSPTTTESFVVPYSASARTIDVSVTNDAGQVSVQFVSGTAFLLKADVTHVGGLFSGHYDGDVVATNSTSPGGAAVSFSLNAEGFGGLFFVGGHNIRVQVNRGLSVALTLTSTTGNVAVDVPAGVVVRSIAATVTTGNVVVTASDGRFANANVAATSTTGSITLDIRQPTSYAGIVNVSGTTTTGGVTLIFRPGTNVGGHVTSRTTTGGISFDSAYYVGVNTNLWAPSQAAYNAAAMKFNINLGTTTGGIDIQ